MSFTGRDPSFTDKTIPNPDSFYPAARLAEFNQIARVSIAISEALVIDALTLAMLQINDELSYERNLWASQSFDSVTDVHPQGELLYRTAVIYRAKEQLTRDYATLTRTQTSDASAREADTVIAHCNLQCESRLALLCGRKSDLNRVSLI